MRRALALAARGGVDVAPNPCVGAVLVSGEKIIGHGWHHRAGEAHAEVLAFQSASSSTSGSTLYVTLEPCNHTGATPPCVDAILAAGVRRVVVAMRDPNPEVAGGGVERLRAAGIEVDIGCLAHEAEQLNRPWVHAMRTFTPRCTGVLVVRLDGSMGDWSELPSALGQALKRRVGRFISHRLAGDSIRDPAGRTVTHLSRHGWAATLSELQRLSVRGVLVDEPASVVSALGEHALDALVLIRSLEFGGPPEAAPHWSNALPALERFACSRVLSFRGAVAALYLVEPKNCPEAHV